MNLTQQSKIALLYGPEIYLWIRDIQRALDYNQFRLSAYEEVMFALRKESERENEAIKD